ncbi:MAG: pyruvate carboxylase [Chitinophagales bacterium]|nr:pyruvate carboxylase [Chitinophagales bacterium]
MQKINKLLVANRGEIAIRTLRAASELEIRTIAIYTYEDRYSLHRYKADESYQIGNDDDPLKPYLDIEEILRIAKLCNADAIHPGYGFLSENINLVRRCAEEKIIFVGPRPDVMEKLGDKVSSKRIARSCNVPIVEGNIEVLTNAMIALQEAERIGFPVILKASAGGGGRGMRVVHDEQNFAKTFEEARREAANAFGDDTMFLEKYVNDPRHIEVQILGDEYGNLVHLFERDCSVQRRFQKVVEIAPAPSLSEEARNKLFNYALRIASAVSYNNAGTVEFLVDKDENIFFIEVNPRIQVEHTVTEEVTGIDIVLSQILIADGKRLDSPEIDIPSQRSITCSGFAIQCRITTEDPQNNFMPDFGTIIAYRNAGGKGIRIDEGSSYQGVKVSPFFDSLLAKVTSHGRNLKDAAARMSRALSEYRIRGVKTNIPFLRKVIHHPVFIEGKTTVRFFENHPELFQVNQQQDRGTKLLRYLANVIVNGNPDVQKSDSTKVFHKPKAPDFSHFEKVDSGTKQKLDALGAEKFCAWLKEEKKIHYTDTTFRDAHQSLLATRVRTLDMMRVAESFAHHHSRIFSMEVWGGATFDVALRFLHECPWKRLQLLRAAIPNILFQMLIRGNNAVGYSSYPNNLVVKFIEESWTQGIDIFRIFDSLNWTKSMSVSIDAVRNYTGGIAEACICYTGDILDIRRQKYNLQYYLDLALELEHLGVHMIGIKDMSGLLKPYAAEVLITELKKVLRIPIHLHTHDTSGIQSATYLKAIEAGVDVIDVALASMSGLTSQPNFNSIVEMMRGQERENSMGIHSLNKFSNYWEGIREYYYPFESGLLAGTAEVYSHEIPGGQYSNLKPQAIGLGLADRMDEIKKTYEDVNALFGDIVKVTPSSKVVGDMAMFMISNNFSKEDVISQGATLSFPESVKGFFRGEIGQPYGGFPSALQKMILKDEKPYDDLPNAHLKPVNFDEELDDFKIKFDSSLTLNDFLSYKMYPKVYEEYYKHQKEFGDVSPIPTTAFFYGMKSNEEILIEIGKGKTLMVRFLYVGDADELGRRTVYFRLNGQTRTIEVFDKKSPVKKVMHRKAEDEAAVGAPLQGLLSKIFVKEGEKLKKNQPLFVIEAMKMETTMTAKTEGAVKRIILPERTLVEADDMILELE